MAKPPVLVLRKRTAAEVRAWREGARLALTWVLSRLPGVVRHPPDATVPATDVLEAVRYVDESIRTSEEAIGAASAEHVERARQHVYDLAAGRARFSMSIPPRASEDSDFVLLAACEAYDAAIEQRDRLRDILAAERGERAPEGWARVDRFGCEWENQRTGMRVDNVGPGQWQAYQWTGQQDHHVGDVMPTALEAIEAADVAARNMPA